MWILGQKLPLTACDLKQVLHLLRTIGVVQRALILVSEIPKLRSNSPPFFACVILSKVEYDPQFCHLKIRILF